MVEKYVALSRDFLHASVDKLSVKSTEGKLTLFSTAAILGSLWGCSKIYFWSKRRKTKQRVQQERESLRNSKEQLYEELKNDKELSAKKEEILRLTFKELQSRLRDGKLSARLALRAYQLKALEVNPDINAIAFVIPDSEELAEQYDANRKPLLLGGIPVTLKDHYTIKGRYATIGLGSYLFRESAEDSVIVKVLKRHGAVPYFITTVPQLLMGLEAKNPIHGTIYNPHDVNRMPGGSSSGEGALMAAGGAPLGWGSDIGGSIREPAAFCGVCGFKPSSSRISHIGSPDFFEGMTLVQNSFGPMSRDVDGLVQAMRALWDGYMFDLDPSVVPITFDEEVFGSSRPLRIGYYTDMEGFARTSPVCRRAVLMAKQHLESQGHQLVRWDFPGFGDMVGVFMRCFLSNDNLDDAKILMAESEVDDSLDYIISTGRYRLIHKLRAVIQTIVSVLSGGMIPLEKDKGSIAEWWDIAAQTKRHRVEVHRAWREAGLDAIICPSSAVPAYYVKHHSIGMLNFPHYIINNLLDMPAGVVPVTHVHQDDLDALSDLNDDDIGVKEIKQTMDQGSLGLPVAVQVSTLTYRDETCLRVMKEVERLKAA